MLRRAEGPAFEPNEVAGITIVRRLGAGSSASVHLGVRDGERFAIKISSRKDTNGEILRRFRMEAAVLHRVRHPAVVVAREVGEIHGYPFTVMEFVPGDTLATRLDHGPIPYREALDLALALAHVLDRVHAAGLVHRDLQPNNMFWDPETRLLRLIDFGLAGAAFDEITTETIGTVTYMSPEQTGAVQRVVEGRTDLYGLGALFFHCLAGRPPFLGAQASDVVHQHVHAPAPDVRQFAPQVPEAAAGIIARLLMKDPDDRPASAAQLLQELQHLTDDPTGLISPGPSDFVGRQQELIRLSEVAAKAMQGKASLVLIEGSPGSGKSRLVQELAALSEGSGALRLAGKCHKRLPFEPLTQIFRQLAEHVAGLDTRAKDAALQSLGPVVRTHAASLVRADRRIASVLGIELPQEAPVIAKEVLHDGLADVLIAIADAYLPLLLIIDDVQWLDDTSRAVFARLLTRKVQAPLLVAATARNDSDSQEALARFIQIMNGHVDQHVALGALDFGDTGELIRRSLGVLGVPHEFVKRAFDGTGGNPFAIGEYLRNVVLSGVLAPRGKSWDVDWPELGRLDLPTNVVDLVRRRIGALAPSHQRVLATAAVLGVEFTADILVRTHAGPPEEVAAALEIARQECLVSAPIGGRWKFVHDRVHEALLAISSESERRSFHQRAALALAPEVAAGRAKNYELAPHFWYGDASVDPAAAYAACVAAAQETARDHELEQALQFYVWAETLAANGGLRTDDLQEAIADLCKRLGKKQEAAARFERALTTAKTPHVRARLLCHLSRNQVENLETEAGLEMLRRAFREVGWTFPSVLRDAVPSLLNAAAGLLIDVTRLGYGMARGERAERYRVLVDLHESAGFVKFFEIDPLTGAIATLRILPFANLLGDCPELARLYAMLSTILGIFKLRRLHEWSSDRASRIAEKIGDPHLVAHVQAYRAYGLGYTGAELEAEHFIRGLLVDYRETLSAENLVYLTGVSMSSMVLRGFPAEALRVAEFGIDRLNRDAGGGVMKEHYLTWCYSYAMSSLVMLGRSTEAQPYRQKLDEYFSAHPNDRYHWGIHLNNLIQLDYEQGETGAGVETLVARHEQLGLFIPLAIMHVRHFYVGQAYVRLNQLRAATPENRGQSRKKLKRAMWQLLQSCDTPMFRSHYHAVKGAWLEFEGKHRQSVQALAKAERYALATNNQTVLYEILLTKARSAAGRGHADVARELATCAWRMCQDHGWALREHRVGEEFGLAVSRRGTRSRNSAQDTMTAVHSSAEVDLAQAERGMKALIRVGLAASRTTDSDVQARTALDEILRVLGGARAALFLMNGKDELQFSSGRTAAGESFDRLTGYSTTVVEKAWREGASVLVNGTDQGDQIGTESIVLNDLRSILAAPVTVGDRRLGVVYIDTQLAKGMFRQEEIVVLSAIATQVGIALEAAKASRTEIEKQSLERDLEVTGTVQKLLIPAARSHEGKDFRVDMEYAPASRSGGDWIWYENRDDGRFTMLMADVTGHGPGPAIITGMISGVMMGLRDRRPDLGQLLATMHQCLIAATKHEFMVACLALEIDRKSETLKLHNSGIPCIGLMKKGFPAVERLMIPGGLLGGYELSVGTKEVPFPPGSRLLVSTDGAFEFLVDDRRFGIKNLLRLFQKSAEMTAPDALAHIRDAVFAACGPVREDDITMALIEARDDG